MSKFNNDLAIPSIGSSTDELQARADELLRMASATQTSRVKEALLRLADGFTVLASRRGALPGQRDRRGGPLREQLGAAIADLNAARKRLEELRSAVTAAVDAVAAATAAHEKAMSDLIALQREAAQPDGAGRAGLNPVAQTIVPARDALADARVTLTAAQKAKLMLDGQLPDARRDVEDQALRVRRIAVEVLGAELGPSLIATTTQARNDLLAGLQQLHWLLRVDAVAASPALSDLLACQDQQPSAWTGIMRAAPGRLPASVQALNDTVNALMTDHTATIVATTVRPAPPS